MSRLVYPLIVIFLASFFYMSFYIERSNIDAASLEIARVKGSSLAHLFKVMRDWNDSHVAAVSIVAGENVDLFSKEEGCSDRKDNGTAYMTKLLGEKLEMEGTNLIFSSLHPLNPENYPDDWTFRALNHIKVSAEFIEHVGDEYRYLSQLRSDASCFKCHEDTGDGVQGGLGFIFPEKEIEGILSKVYGDSKKLYLSFFLVSSGLAVLAVYIYRYYSVVLLRSYLRSKELKKEYSIDSLTGVMTRKSILGALTERLKLAKRDNKSLSLLMIDLDNFKSVNDTYGHLAGDIVLREVATSIRTALREKDLLGRFGGEEFIVVLPDTGRVEAISVAERVRQSVYAEEITVASEKSIGVSVSVGVAESSVLRTNSKNELLESADKAMYRAKRGGRNKVC